MTKYEPLPFLRLISKINSIITDDYNLGLINQQIRVINFSLEHIDTEAFLEPNRASTMERFCENS